MAQMRASDETLKRLNEIKEDDSKSSLDETVQALIETYESVSKLQERVENQEKYVVHDEIVDKIYDELNLQESTPIPKEVGQNLIGSRKEEEIPRLIRLFVEGIWMFNENFARSPSYVDVVMVSDGAVLKFKGGIGFAEKERYFFVDRENYNDEIIRMFRAEKEVMLPPGGINVEWRQYQHETEIPVVEVSYSGSDYWPIIGYGYGEVTEEDVMELMKLRTVEQAVYDEGVEKREEYEEIMEAHQKASEKVKTDDTNREGLIFTGIHVSEPVDSYESFFNWCLSRSDWSPREGINSLKDVRKLPND